MSLVFNVLILVLVEDSLGEKSKNPDCTRCRTVLILVLVEDSLGANKAGNHCAVFNDGLNPCFSGR